EFSDKARRKPNGKRTRSYDNILERFLKEHNIKHHFIRPRTPQHNGKVERSHRTDQDKFYSHLSFYSLEDLRKQGRARNKRYNEMPKFVLGFKSPNEIELEKLKELSNIII
ncbi:MAG: integrase core domain-containing protein, partial [Bacilli bacterium]